MAYEDYRRIPPDQYRDPAAADLRLAPAFGNQYYRSPPPTDYDREALSVFDARPLNAFDIINTQIITNLYLYQVAVGSRFIARRVTLEIDARSNSLVNPVIDQFGWPSANMTILATLWTSQSDRAGSMTDINVTHAVTGEVTLNPYLLVDSQDTVGLTLSISPAATFSITRARVQLWGNSLSDTGIAIAGEPLVLPLPFRVPK